ncbi:hypothetical protein L6452_35032 [Arctium lappa]|uniref:Uncharacterized protein n=1 Tax=Arctium lappa TaxID=4217 RepID=A0ACB8YKD0_ARCLA|nr:hypothetical protein L6452_35032 [Arctium lappa]
MTLFCDEDFIQIFKIEGDWEVDMAGKSSRGRNKKVSHNTTNVVVTEQVVASNGHAKDSLNYVEETKVDANGVPDSIEISTTKPEVKESENASSENQVKQG